MSYFLIYMFLTLTTYVMYIYRFKIFLCYCDLCEYYSKHNNKSITTQKNKCFIFNHIEHSLVNISKKQYLNNNNNDFLTIMEKNGHYTIFPNKTDKITQSPFIICEVIFKDKHYDITNLLKLFYIKNNIILTRPFISYIFYKFFDIHITINDNYSIKYIDINANIKIIDTDITIYSYTI